MSVQDTLSVAYGIFENRHNISYHSYDTKTKLCDWCQSSLEASKDLHKHKKSA